MMLRKLIRLALEDIAVIFQLRTHYFSRMNPPKKPSSDYVKNRKRKPIIRSFLNDKSNGMLLVSVLVSVLIPCIIFKCLQLQDKSP
jgi:hypothetical protein